MSRSALELRLDDLRYLTRQVRSAVTGGSLEQRARYKELQGELDAIEQDVEEAAPASELEQRVNTLLAAFQRFQRHLEPGKNAAA
jgi:hypothetical protein